MTRTFEQSFTLMLFAFVGVFCAFAYFQVPDEHLRQFLAISTFGCLFISAASTVIAFYAGTLGFLMAATLLGLIAHNINAL